LLLMESPAVVQIIGAPVACTDGVKDSWRETAEWAAGQLAMRFGDAVRVEYFDLFDLGCPPLAEGAQLPLVLVNGQVVSSGGKISIPTLRRRIEEIGIAPVPSVGQSTG
jgi:disulfide oxidoreductase YuzD